jgi:hypothetical protein
VEHANPRPAIRCRIVFLLHKCIEGLLFQMLLPLQYAPLSLLVFQVAPVKGVVYGGGDRNYRRCIVRLPR